MSDQRNDSPTSQWSGESAPSESLGLLNDFPAPSIDEWRQAVERDLKGAEFDKKLLWKTPEGITVKPLYTRDDLKELDYLSNQLPGFAPHARGTYALSGVSPSWQIRQDCTLAAPEDVNASLRDAIARGQDSIAIRLDNAARQGLDGDDADARELTGRAGCTLSSINGLRIALQDIDIARYPVTFRTGTSALPVLAMFVALADERGVPRETLVGAVECDPMRELVKTGRLRASLDVHYREMADMVSFCSANCRGIRSVLVNSSPWHNAGGSAVQELAYTLAAATEYMRAMTSRGITPDDAALGISFSFSVSTNLFMEIAKLRAARMLWTNIVKAFGAKTPGAAKMFLHVRTSTHDKSVYDPYNNMIRTAIEAFAGAVGGCDSMFVAPFDETLGRPDDFSIRLARNQQLVLKEEAHLTRVADPAGGSYYIESMTDAIAREAWKLFQETEALGGLVAALIKGAPQKAIGETAARKHQMITQRRQPIVGVSNYPNPKEKLPVKRHIPRAEFVEARRQRLARLKSVRRNSQVRALLTAMTQAVASGEGNLLEIAITAAAEGATMGEMLRAIGRGASDESLVVEPIFGERMAVPFERLRERAASYAEQVGAPPKAFLITMGPLGMRRARADFSAGFLGAGGFNVEEPAAFKDPIEGANAAVKSGAKLVVICSDDPSYPQIAPVIAKTIKAQSSGILVYVAGYPQESIDELTKAGVDGFIHIKADVVQTLGDIMKAIGC